jgi:hypothetical protein
MHTPLRNRVFIPFVAVALISPLGCSLNLTDAPSVQSALVADRAALASTTGLYFPLEQGNRWHAAGDLRAAVVSPSGATTLEIEVHQDFVRTISGTEQRFGRTYSLMSEDETDTGDVENGYDEYIYWIRYRQDRSGLYEADVDLTTPPGGTLLEGSAASTARRLSSRILAAAPTEQRAAYESAWDQLNARASAIRNAIRTSAGPPPSGAQENELTRLRYPLRPGQTWTIRTNPSFTSVVEAVEPVEVPAGRFTSHRMRIESEFIGPSDRVTVWMSRSGQVAFAYHLETNVTDENGNPAGTLASNYREELQDLGLVGP